MCRFSSVLGLRTILRLLVGPTLLSVVLLLFSNIVGAEPIPAGRIGLGDGLNAPGDAVTEKQPLSGRVVNGPAAVARAAGEWNLNPVPMPYDRPMFDFRQIVRSGYVYNFGGRWAGSSGDFTDYVGRTQILPDNTLGVWEPLSSLPDSLWLADVTQHGDWVYVVGGYDTVGPTDAVWRAQVQPGGSLGPWEPQPNLPARLYGHRTLVQDGTLFAYGGWRSQAVYASTIGNDGSLGAWNLVGNLPVELYAFAQIVTDNRLYLIGGKEILPGDIQTIVPTVRWKALSGSWTPDAWTIVDPLPEARWFHAAALSGSVVYVVGGLWLGDGVVSSGTIHPDASIDWSDADVPPVIPSWPWGPGLVAESSILHCFTGLSADNTLDANAIYSYDLETENCYPDLPAPTLVFEGTELYVADGNTYVRYHFDIPNWSEYPADLFVPAPDLPPCGLNPTASRTWLDFYRKDGTRIYGFCGFMDPSNLQLGWFGTLDCADAPDSVYAKIWDRRCDQEYVSNLVAVYHPDLTIDVPEFACPGSDIEVCGNVTNCSEIPIDITVEIEGETQSYPNVAPGGAVQFCSTLIMPAVVEPDTAAVIPVTVTAGPDQVTVTEGAVIGVGPCNEISACPRTIGFWRQQCAQKDNGSTKVCLAGMKDLWRCVIEKTDVEQWKLNDGGYETTADLAVLSDADLFVRLCNQVQGPRPMTIRDMAEIQYLSLMLNVCSGALPLSTLLDGSGGFTGTVAEAIEEIENSLNTDEDLGDWKDVADDINNRIGVLAADCAEGNDLFRNLPPCGDEQAPGALIDTAAQSGLTLQAFPNPVVARATTIRYTVPGELSNNRIEINVFDVSGRLVRQLMNEPKTAGQYDVRWDLRDTSGGQVPSGVYFYRVKAGTEERTQRLMVLPR